MTLRIATALFLVGCASSGGRTPGERPAVAVLTVTNQRIGEATIYVIHEGHPGRRLGQVGAFATATFVLTALDAPIAGDVQFLAKSFVTRTSDVSDPVLTQRGARYEWRLGPAQGHQFLSFRMQ